MTTNLILLYPDIPQNIVSYKTYGTSTSDTSNETDFSPALNTFRGERWQEWNSVSSKTTHNLVYDLGSSVTKATSFLVVTKMDRLVSALTGATDFLLQSSSDDSTYTSRISLTNIQNYTSSDLLGRFSRDYVTTITATSPFRYWRARINNSASNAFTLRCGKIYFGSPFDFGREPEGLPQFNLVDLAGKSFTSSAGMIKKARLRVPFYQIKIKWIGLTDALIQSFYTTIYKRKDTTPVFLYTQSYHQVLNNFRLMHCKIEDAVTSQDGGIANYNTLEVTFRELIG